MLMVELMIISTSPKLRQILLHWCYELVESDLL